MVGRETHSDPHQIQWPPNSLAYGSAHKSLHVALASSTNVLQSLYSAQSVNKTSATEACGNLYTA